MLLCLSLYMLLTCLSRVLFISLSHVWHTGWSSTLCIYVYVYVCMYVYTCICMYIYVFAYHRMRCSPACLGCWLFLIRMCGAPVGPVCYSFLYARCCMLACLLAMPFCLLILCTTACPVGCSFPHVTCFSPACQRHYLYHVFHAHGAQLPAQWLFVPPL